MPNNSLHHNKDLHVLMQKVPIDSEVYDALKAEYNHDRLFAESWINLMIWLRDMSKSDKLAKDIREKNMQCHKEHSLNLARV